MERLARARGCPVSKGLAPKKAENGATPRFLPGGGAENSQKRRQHTCRSNRKTNPGALIDPIGQLLGVPNRPICTPGYAEIRTGVQKRPIGTPSRVETASGVQEGRFCTPDVRLSRGWQGTAARDEIPGQARNDYELNDHATNRKCHDHQPKLSIIPFFLSESDDVLFSTESPINISIQMSTNKVILVGIVVQGTSAKRVRVRAFKRVRNGKTEFVKAHWRHYRR